MGTNVRNGAHGVLRNRSTMSKMRHSCVPSCFARSFNSVGCVSTISRPGICAAFTAATTWSHRPGWNRKSMLYPSEKRFFKCCSDPRHEKLPPTMIPMRLHSASHSSMECDVSTMVLPFVLAEITSHMNRRASGSIPVDGSSSSTTAGEPTSAIATDSFRLLPPEYVPACFSQYLLSAIFSISDETTPSMSSSGTPLTCA
mmetsp:Transcript_279/g.948  ORF Transcript_279/g.948 Transcript_279/m.948 type:complete len:200 (+) Transcript_279:692-1291(+)